MLEVSRLLSSLRVLFPLQPLIFIFVSIRTIASLVELTSKALFFNFETLNSDLRI